MSDTTHTANPVVVRQAQPSAAPAQVTQALAGVTGQLPEVLQLCNAIADAGDLAPPAYRGKPGAVLLAKIWADAHDVDVFTAMQNVYPIEGKPFVSAEMRVALATQAGYEFRTIECTDEVCTIEVWQHRHTSGHGLTPRLVGNPVTCRFDDRPRRLKYASGKATPWATHPADMLLAEASRKADRRYVKTAAVLVDTAQDLDDTEPAATVDDLVEVLAPEAEQAAPVEQVYDEGERAASGERNPRAAAAVETPEADPDTERPVTEADLRKAGKVAEILRSAKTNGADVALVGDIIEDQKLARAVLADLEAIKASK